MVGARTTLYVGLVAVGIAAIIGTPLGIIAGMVRPRGGRARSCGSPTSCFAFPALLLAIMFAAVYGGRHPRAMVAIGIASVPRFVRVVARPARCRS